MNHPGNGNVSANKGAELHLQAGMLPSVEVSTCSLTSAAASPMCVLLSLHLLCDLLDTEGGAQPLHSV